MKNATRPTLIPPLFLLLAAALVFASAASAGVCPATTAPGQPRLAVHHYLYDAPQKQSWAVVVDCLHPEWPAVLEPVVGMLPGDGGVALAGTEGVSSPLHGAGRSSSSAQAWVLAGARVRFWKAGPVRILLSGVAVESAPPGATVGVRVGDPGGEAGIVLHGIVRGPDSVELVEGGLTWQP